MAILRSTFSRVSPICSANFSSNSCTRGSDSNWVMSGPWSTFSILFCLGYELEQPKQNRMEKVLQLVAQPHLSRGVQVPHLDVGHAVGVADEKIGARLVEHRHVGVGVLPHAQGSEVLLCGNRGGSARPEQRCQKKIPTGPRAPRLKCPKLYRIHSKHIGGIRSELISIRQNGSPD